MTQGVKQYSEAEAQLVKEVYNRGYKKGYDEVNRLRAEITQLKNKIRLMEIAAGVLAN